MAEAEEAEAAVTHLNASPRGTLKVNTSMVFGMHHVAPAVPEFLSRFPELALDMTMTDEYLDLIDDGYDLAVRIGELESSSLIARKLAPCRFAVCASPDYLAKHGVPRAPHDLVRHTCLRYAYQSSQDVWQFEGPRGPQ